MITATANIRRTDGRLVRRVALPLQSAESEKGRGSLSYSTRIPLRGLAAGGYTLEVNASDSAGQAVDRAVAFTVPER